jgi:hypothetical protein
MDSKTSNFRQTLQNGCLIVLAMIVMSCLISTMTVFMGGGQQGTDLRSLMIIQLASIPASGAAALVSFILLKSSGPNSNTSKRIWSAVPQWMVFGFLLLNSLVVAGEMAFLIVSKATDQVVSWTDHVPLVCMLTCTLAFCIVYGSASLLAGKSSAMSGRW